MKKYTRRRGGMFTFATKNTPTTPGFHFPQGHSPTPFGVHAATVARTRHAASHAQAAAHAQSAAAHAHAAASHAQAAAQAAHVSPNQSRKKRKSRSRSRSGSRKR